MVDLRQANTLHELFVDDGKLVVRQTRCRKPASVIAWQELDYGEMDLASVS